MRQKSHQHNTLEANNSKSKRALQVHKGVADVNELIRRFEMQKIQDIRSVLLNLTAIQLKQHTRAIELLSAAYQEITNIDQIIDAEVNAQTWFNDISDEFDEDESNWNFNYY